MPEFLDLPRGLPGSPAGSGTAPRALWMHPSTLSESPFWRYGAGKLFLGTSAQGGLVGIADNRHLLTVAGSRAGKGVSVIVPNLMLYEGSMLTLDPKGENATLTAERRGMGQGIEAGGLGQEVHVLDPFGVADVPDEYRSGYNPLADLDPESPNFVDDCDSIADAVVLADPGEQNSHWNATARQVIRGITAWVGSGETDKRSLATVYDLLHLHPDDFGDLLDAMLAAPERGWGVPTQMAASVLGMGSNERGSVLSTVRQNLLFLSSPPMAKLLSGGARQPDLKAWKMGGMTIYLCLPASRLHRHNRFFRLILNRLLGAVESTRDVPAIPAVMILDEMHVIGHMAMLETAAGLIAGYGVRIWSIWQDFAQLKDLYRARWETFLGNASVFQSFGLNDMTTLDYVSKRLGTSSMMSISQSELTRDAAASGMSGQSRSIQGTPLLSPDEVAFHFSRQSNNQLILYPGADPIWLKRTAFYDAVFKSMRPRDE